MENEIYEIIKYLNLIRDLKRWDLIMIWNDFYEYVGFYSEKWIHLNLLMLDLDDNEQLTKEQCEYTLDFYNRDILFENQDFNVKRWKKLLEEIIEEYSKD